MAIPSFIKSTSKSFGYAVGDVFSDYSPTIASIVKGTRDLTNKTNRAARSMQNDNISQATKDMKSGKSGYNDLLNDLISGKGYSDDEDDENLVSNDEDWGDDSSDNSAKSIMEQNETNSRAIVKSITKSNNDLSKYIGYSSAKSAEYIVKSNAASSRALYDLNKQGFTQVTQVLLNMNNTLDAVASLGEPLTAHMQNSAIFYTTTTDTLNKMYKSMSNIEKSLQHSNRLGGGRYKSKTGTIDDFIMGETFDIKAYLEMVKKNAKEVANEYSGIKNKKSSKTSNGGLTQQVMTMAMGMIMPSAMKASMQMFDEALRNTLTAGLSQAGIKAGKSNNPIVQLLGQVFLPKDNYKNKIDTSNYQKGQVAWDGIARKALIEVIPGYLSQIVSLLGGEAKHYDYDRGKFTSTGAIRGKRAAEEHEYAARAGGDFRKDALRKAGNNKEIAAQIEAYFDEAFKRGTDFGNVRNKVRRGSSGTTDRDYLKSFGLTEESAIILANLLDSYDKSKYSGVRNRASRMGAAVARERNAYGRKMAAEEASGHSIYNVLENGSSLGTDKVGNTQLDYLIGIYENTALLASNISYIAGKTDKFKNVNFGRTKIRHGRRSNIYRNNSSTRSGERSNMDTRSDREAYESEYNITKEDSTMQKAIDRYDRSYRQEILSISKGESTNGRLQGNSVFARAYNKVLDFISAGTDGLNAIFWGKDGKDGLIDKFFNKIETLASKLEDNLKSLFDKLKDTFDEKFGGIKSKIKEKYQGFKQSMSNEWGNIKGWAGRKINSALYGRTAAQDIDRAAKGRRVTKRGLVSVSEGELIIPSEYNPYYHGATNKAQQMRNEQYIVNRFYGSFAKGGIPIYGGGSDLDDYDDSMDILSQAQEGIRSEKIQKAKSAAIKGGKGVAGFFAKGGQYLYQGITSLIVDIVGDGKKENAEKTKKSIMDNLGKAMGDVAGSTGAMGIGAIAGTGVSLLTGAVLGPIAGAALGAGAGLLFKSQSLQKALFGDYYEDENGEKKYREGLLGEFGKTLRDNKDTLGSMGIGAGVGATAGLFMGSPIIGAIAGATIGYMKKSKSSSDWLFGEMDENGERKDNGVIPKDIQEKIKKSAPAIAAGIIGGAALGPFGIVGNIMLGGGLGYLTTTQKFHEWMFGKEGDKHDKGVTGQLNDIVHNLGNAITGGIRRFGLRINNMLTSLGKKINDAVSKMMNSAKNSNGIIGKGARLISGATEKIGGGIRGALGGIQNGLKKHNLDKGNGVYDYRAGRNLSAKERSQLRTVLRNGGVYEDNGRYFKVDASGRSKEITAAQYEKLSAKNATGKQYKANSTFARFDNYLAGLSDEDTLSLENMDDEALAQKLANEGGVKGLIGRNGKINNIKLAQMKSLIKSENAGLRESQKALEEARKKDPNYTDIHNISGILQRIAKKMGVPDDETNEVNAGRTIDHDMFGNVHVYDEEGNEVFDDTTSRQSNKLIKSFTDSVMKIPGISTALEGIHGLFGSVKDKLFGKDGDPNDKGLLGGLFDSLFGKEGYMKGIFNFISNTPLGTGVKNVLSKGTSFLKGGMSKLSTYGLPVAATALVFGAFSGFFDEWFSDILAKIGLSNAEKRTEEENANGATVPGGNTGAINPATGKPIDPYGNYILPGGSNKKNALNMTGLAQRRGVGGVYKGSEVDYDIDAIGKTHYFGKNYSLSSQLWKNAIGGTIMQHGSVGKSAVKGLGNMWAKTPLGGKVAGMFGKGVSEFGTDFAGTTLTNMIDSRGSVRWFQVAEDGKKTAVAAKNIEAMAKGGANLADDAATSGMMKFANTVDDVAKQPGLLEGIIKTLSNFFETKFPSILKMVPGVSDDVAKSAGPAIMEHLVPVIEKAGSKLATFGSKLATALPYIQIAYVGGRAINAWGDAESILGITDTATPGQRFVAVLLAVINASIPFIGDLIPDKTLVDIFMKVAPKLGFDVSNLAEQRAQADEQISAYNETHGTKYTVEQYNQEVLGRMGAFTRTGNVIKNTWADTKNTFANMKNQISEKGIGGAIKDFANNTVASFKESFDNNGGGISGAIAALGETMGEMLPGIYGEVANANMKIKSLAVKGEIGELWKVSLPSFSKKENNEGIETAVPDIFSRILGQVPLLMNKVQMTPIALVAKVGVWVKDLAKSIFDKISGPVKNIATNGMTIQKLSYEGDVQKLLDYTPNDSEGNPLGGVFSAIGWVQKIMLIPQTAVFGVGKAIKNGFTKIINGAKEIGQSMAENEKIGEDIIYSRGSLDEMLDFSNINISEDNPLGGIGRAAIIGSRLFAIPVTLVKKISNDIKNTFTNVVNGVKDAASALVDNETTMGGFIAAGDITGLWSNTVEYDGNNIVGGLLSGVNFVTKLYGTVPTALSWAGHKIFDFGVKAKDAIVKSASAVYDNYTKIHDSAKAGDIKAVWSNDVEENEDNPISGIMGGVNFVQKLMQTPTALVHFIGNKLKEGVTAIKDAVTGDVSKFKEYMDKYKGYAEEGNISSIWTDRSSFSLLNPLGGLFENALNVNRLFNTLVAIFNKIAEPIKEVIDKAKGFVEDIGEEVGEKIEWVGDKAGKAKDAVVSGASNAYNSAKNAVHDAASNAWDSFTGMITGGSSGFVSQYDPRYSNIPISGTNFANKGCGPAVASMMASAYGKKLSVKDAMRASGGYQNPSGVSADYFQKALAGKGINTQIISGGSSAQMYDKLARGEKMILLGRDAYNRSKDNSPFGPSNHYVLATGLDRSGNVIVNDPELRGPRRYSSRILHNAMLGISGGASGSAADWNLGSWSPVSESELNDYIASKNSTSPFNGRANVFIKAGEESGLDPRYILAHAAVESGWGTSRFARERGNYYGIGAFDSNPNNAYTFADGSSSGDMLATGIIEGAKWISSHYYNGKYGQTTVNKMRYNNGVHQYCTSDTWANSIGSIMEGAPANSKVSLETTPLDAVPKGLSATVSSSSGSTPGGATVNGNSINDAAASSGSTGSTSGSTGSSGESKGGGIGKYLGAITSAFSSAFGKLFNGSNDESSSSDSSSSGSTGSSSSSSGAYGSSGSTGSSGGYNGSSGNANALELNANNATDRFIEAARSQIGVVEGPNNLTEYGAFTGMQNQPWCSSFVSWSADKAVNGDKDAASKILRGGPTASVSTLWDRFKAAGAMTNQPQKGDIVIYKNNTSHTGIVESVDGNRISTIEGNTSGPKGKSSSERNGGEVATKSWTLGDGSGKDRALTGFGRPDWGALEGMFGGSKTSNYGGSLGDKYMGPSTKSNYVGVNGDHYTGSGSGLGFISYGDLALASGGSSGLLMRSRIGSVNNRSAAIGIPVSKQVKLKRMSGGDSSIIEQTSAMLTNLKNTVTNGNNGSISGGTADQLIQAIIKILERIADNTAPVEKIYSALTGYVSAGGASGINPAPVNNFNITNNQGSTSVGTTVNNTRMDNVDSSIVSLVDMLANIAKG